MPVEFRIIRRKRETEIKFSREARLVHHRPVQNKCLQKARKIRRGPVPHDQHQSPFPWPKADPGQWPIQLRRRQLLSILSDRKHECRKLSFFVMEGQLESVRQQPPEHDPQLLRVGGALLLRHCGNIVPIRSTEILKGRTIQRDGRGVDGLRSLVDAVHDSLEPAILLRNLQDRPQVLLGVKCSLPGSGISWAAFFAEL